jgi:cytoskeletal protein CcmA (bactofilin family)
MTRPAFSWKRLVPLSALLLVALFGLTQSAQADWIIRGDTIPAGQVIDNDVIITGTDVRVDGTVNGDLVALGSTVSVNGTVEGSAVAAGRTITLNGDVGGSVYVAATTLRLGPSFYVRHNVHFGGLLLDSQPGSQIGRDLVAAAIRARIGSKIGRGLQAIIALMSFNGQIGFDLEEPQPAPESSLERDAPQPVTEETGSTLLFVSALGHQVPGFAAPTRLAALQPEEEGPAVPEWLVTRLGELVALLLVGGLALWLIRPWFDRWLGRLRTKPLPATGFGVLGLIIFANAIWLAVLLGVMLIAVGIWLGNVTLWELAFLFWGIGLSLLVLALSLLALAVFYVSKVIVAYLVALLILERLVPRVIRYRVVVLLVGVLLYEVLRAIPTLGWVIEVIVVVLGLGAIWLGFRADEEPPAELIAESAVLETTP